MELCGEEGKYVAGKEVAVCLGRVSVGRRICYPKQIRRPCRLSWKPPRAKGWTATWRVRSGQKEQTLPLRTPHTRVPGGTYRDAHSSIICNSGKLNTTYPSSGDWMHSEEFRPWRTPHAALLKIAEFKPCMHIREGKSQTHTVNSVCKNSGLHTYDPSTLRRNFILQYNFIAG